MKRGKNFAFPCANHDLTSLFFSSTFGMFGAEKIPAACINVAWLLRFTFDECSNDWHQSTASKQQISSKLGTTSSCRCKEIRINFKFMYNFDTLNKCKLILEFESLIRSRQVFDGSTLRFENFVRLNAFWLQMSWQFACGMHRRCHLLRF